MGEYFAVADRPSSQLLFFDAYIAGRGAWHRATPRCAADRRAPPLPARMYARPPDGKATFHRSMLHPWQSERYRHRRTPSVAAAKSTSLSKVQARDCLSESTCAARVMFSWRVPLRGSWSSRPSWTTSPPILRASANSAQCEGFLTDSSQPRITRMVAAEDRYGWSNAGRCPFRDASTVLAGPPPSSRCSSATKQRGAGSSRRHKAAGAAARSCEPPRSQPTCREMQTCPGEGPACRSVGAYAPPMIGIRRSRHAPQPALFSRRTSAGSRSDALGLAKPRARTHRAVCRPGKCHTARAAGNAALTDPGGLRTVRRRTPSNRTRKGG